MAKKNEEKKKLRFSQEQYDMLKRCSDKQDMTEWNQWRENNPNVDVWLEGQDFSKWYLKRVMLRKLAEEGDVYLQGAIFNNARLESAKFNFAHLHNSKFIDANVEGAIFYKAHLQGANFRTVLTNGATSFWESKVDADTDFRGVSLGNVRIHPRTKQLLEYGMRRRHWMRWYRWKDWHKDEPEEERCGLSQLIRLPLRLFWWVSDYGRSIGRIAWTFFVLAFFFAAIYSNMAYWLPPGVVSNLEVEPHSPIWHYFLLALLRPIYFSVVTMTTLGFGDMYANAQSIWGHVLLTFQVILGYVLLGALVTRFAVLFTAGGPAGKFAGKVKE